MLSTIRKKTLQIFPRWGYLLLLCLCIPFLTSCEGKKTIVNSLDEKDANEILVFLSSRNIDAEKIQATGGGSGGGNKEVKWDISVNSSEASEAMRLLNQQGLPRRRSENLLGVFSSSGLVPSDLQEKIKYRAALAAELASTIRKYEGVLDADVLVSFPEEDPLNPGKMKGKITAAVWVEHSGVLDDPNSHMMSRIKRYVASAVTGLDPDNVTVIGERSRLGELPEAMTSMGQEEEKQYVDVWSVIIAKESVSRFRVIFFSFSVALLVLLLALVWIFWKVHPLLREHGGIKALLSIHPLQEGAEKIPAAAPPKPAKKEEAKGAAHQKPTADKDFDET